MCSSSQDGTEAPASHEAKVEALLAAADQRLREIQRLLLAVCVLLIVLVLVYLL